MRTFKAASKSKDAKATAIISAKKSQSSLPAIKSRLERIIGVHEVQIIALTSNVLVRYDPKIITLDAIRSSLAE
jgi:hypothetical protein